MKKRLIINLNHLDLEKMFTEKSRGVYEASYILTDEIKDKIRYDKPIEPSFKQCIIYAIARGYDVITFRRGSKVINKLKLYNNEV